MKISMHLSVATGLLALVVAAITLSGCGQASQATDTPAPAATSTSEATTMPTAMPTIAILQIAETGAYQAAISKDLGDITWTALTQTTGISDEAEAQAAVIEAIKANGAKLAAVDYAALSLDAFKDVTSQLQLKADSFVGGDMRLESLGKQNNSDTWLLYDYHGPDMPKMPDRPQVTRWVQIYALYSVPQKAVVRLLATVRGEVQE